MVFRTDVGLWALADVLLLLLVMDTAMYWLHRIAHWASLYPWVHQTFFLYLHVR
ncbi:MAG: hypothetical protein H0T73_16440 [Ardenticatenales bacterium]|nr:hypothetical protein [Ardenticatenales bacterium]